MAGQGFDPALALAWPRGESFGRSFIGALHGLVAMGMILAYRDNRIINFAQAQLGAVPAIVARLLITRHVVPYVVAIPVMLIGSALLGAGV